MFAFCRQTPQLHFFTKVFLGAIYIHAFTMSHQLGLYEYLRQKAIATNQGMSPTLYQEAACGLTVGAAGACISFPLYVGYLNKQYDSCLPTELQSWNSRNEFRFFCSIAAKKESRLLVRLVSPLFKRKMWFDVGALASYNPSLHYLRESCGFSETRAQLGASAVSAFFAAACSLPPKHIHLAQENEYARTSLDCALQILKSRGPLGFFAGFPSCLLRVAPPVMTTWFALERIRELELSFGL